MHGYSGAMHQHPTSLRAAFRRLGVLGGMGPMATVDFLQKVVENTEAHQDQDHIPMLVDFCTQAPDRASALLGLGASPLGALIQSAQALERSGAQAVVMPCNTAHAWYDAIASAIGIPMIHIVDVSMSEAHNRGGASATMGLLATSGTLQSGIYPSRGRTANWVIPTPQEQATWVMPAIAAIKAQHLDKGAALLRLAGRALVERGANVILMGCTEIPLALSQQDFRVPLIDSSLALAKASIAWAGGTVRGEAPRLQAAAFS